MRVRQEAIATVDSSSPPTTASAGIRRAVHLLAIAAAVLIAGMASPYGWGVYKNVLFTVNSQYVMRIPEWWPVTGDPTYYWAYFMLLAVLALTWIKNPPIAPFWRREAGGEVDLIPPFWRRGAGGEVSDVGGTLVILMFAVEGWLHVRMIPLFAIVATVIAGPSILAAFGPKSSSPLPSEERAASGEGLGVRARLLTAGALVIYMGAIASVGLTDLIPELTPGASTPNDFGAATVREGMFPAKACAFMQAQGFPTNLRLLNDYIAGGYIFWRLPGQKVFVDGRTDVYLGGTLTDYDAILSGIHSPAGSAVMGKYDFDCVLTGSPGMAHDFGTSPGWSLVYAEPMTDSAGNSLADKPHYWIILRNRPQYRDLIERCQSMLPR